MAAARTSRSVPPKSLDLPGNGAIGGAIGKNKVNTCGAIANGTAYGTDWFVRKLCEVGE